jgi:hypothetical protein
MKQKILLLLVLWCYGLLSYGQTTTLQYSANATATLAQFNSNNGLEVSFANFTTCQQTSAFIKPTSTSFSNGQWLNGIY